MASVSMIRACAAVAMGLGLVQCTIPADPPPLINGWPPHSSTTSQRAFAEIERSTGGRLGVAMVGRDLSYITGRRSDERFALCSTFKLPLAAMVLDGHARGLWSLDERLRVTPADIVAYSPAMNEALPAGQASIGDAARAAVTLSDNAAANLLLRRVGGIAAFNAWLRTHGDTQTRLDRMEPDLNENRSGDLRDTTTPAAMARLAAQLIFGDVLPPAERQRLRGWLRESQTGLRRIRAGLPAGWEAGDKTGTCGGDGRESYNDVAYFVPDSAGDEDGIVLAAYLDRPMLRTEAESSLAEVGRVYMKMIEEIDAP